MAKKGHPSRQKRMSVSPIRHVARKEFTWTTRQKPGNHTQKLSVPLSFVIRDMLGIATTMRETKQILNKGIVIVDGTMRKDPRFAVGLFDTISIPSIKKNYRLILDAKGRLKSPEATESVLANKPAKVVHKALVAGNKMLVQTHDGKTYRGADKAIHVDDSVLISADGKKITKHIALAKGSPVLITGGSHVGEVAMIAHLVEGTMRRKKLVDLTEGKEKFQTTAYNVMAIDASTLEWLKKVNTGGNAE